MLTKAEIAKLSIVEKVKLFADLAEGTRVDDEIDIKELLTDIGKHGAAVHEYIIQLRADAEKLQVNAQKLHETAVKQSKKAGRYEDYLKQAMLSSGFDKLKAGNLRMKVITVNNVRPKREPTERDFIQHPEWVQPKFYWQRDPVAADKIDHADIIDTKYDWDFPKVRAAYKEAPDAFDDVVEKNPTYRLDVKVDKLD